MFVQFFVKISKLIETFKLSYTQARVHGDDHKIQLIYYFPSTFASLIRQVGLKHSPDHTVNVLLLTTNANWFILFCICYGCCAW